MQSAGLMKSMGDYAFKSPDASVRARALAWIDIAPGTANFDALLRTLGALGTALRNNSLPWLNEHYLGAFTTHLQSVFNQARVAASPLILDLDGDGVETIGQAYDVHFDHDGNGLAERTGWASKDDGLLVRDLDGSGTIDDGGELFGNNTLLASEQKAANGFEALGGLDGNNDGSIDSADAVFAQLRIWKDANQDGVTQDGELFTLVQAGIASIGTGYRNQTVTDANGNQHLQTGSFTTTTGVTRKVDDVWFGQDTARTTEVDAVAETDAIRALPELAGMGRVHGLHQTLARAANPVLEGLLSRFAATTDEATLRPLTTSIIYQWTGVQNASPTSRGIHLGDARMLLALEAVLGTDFVQRSGTNAGTADPGPNAAAAVVQSFDLLQSQVYGQLLLQTQYAAVLEGTRLTVDDNGPQLNTDAAVGMLRAGYDQRAQAAPVSGQPAPASNAEAWLQRFFAALPTLGEAGVSLSLQLAASGDLRAPGFDHALTAMGLNAITGDARANALIGTAGGDLIDGRDGNDTLNGGAGNDTYLFAKGGGQDTIKDYDTTARNSDTLWLGGGLDASTASVSRIGNDLTLAWDADAVTVQNYFLSTAFRVERIVSGDGTAWNYADIANSVVYEGTTDADTLTGISGQTNRIQGFAGNDTITGGSLDDVLYGGEGNDVLNGGAGNDSMVGGAGNDELNGGTGNDTYGFGRGCGMDTLFDYDTTAGNADLAVFDTDVAADQLWFGQSGAHLEVGIIGTSDTLTISNWFSGSRYHVEKFQASDGKVLLDTQVQNLVQAMAGFAPPAAGQTTLPTNYASLNTVIAANWH